LDKDNLNVLNLRLGIGIFRPHMQVSRTLWANLALSLIAPILFFVFSEGILLLLKVQPLALTDDPYVGYSASQPLFVPANGPDGVPMMVTNPVKVSHFNLQKFPQTKSAGTYRIFSLGGSTAYGHPWRDPTSFTGWLRALLPIADSSHAWEVINCGGISYASYREAMLVAEIIKYQPDLIIVYSGHNEFLEERTYRKTAGIPFFIRELSATLDRTRTYSSLRRLARKFQPENPTTTPTSPTPGTKPKADQLAGEVNDILANTIGPTSYTRNDTLKQDILEHYKISLTRMAALAHSVGAEVIFLTTPTNEKDCSPFKSEATPGITDRSKEKVSEWMQKARALAETPLDALVLYDSALSLDSRNAAIYYLAGQAALAAKKYPEAKYYFRQALDEDICPLRALTAMRNIVLETAKEQHAQAVDFVRILEEKTNRESGHNILGEPDFVDHVHLSIDDYRFIAITLVNKLESMGVLKKSTSWNEASIKQVTDRIMGSMGPHELGEGLHNLAKVVNWAGKHEDAARIAARALSVDSLGVEAIWSSLFVGAAMERQGREAEALPHYRRAVRLDTNNSLSHQYLAASLMRQALDQEAAKEFATVLELDPRNEEAMSKLSELKLRLGNSSDAIAPLEISVKNNPSRADFRYLLGEALLRSGHIDEARQRFREALEKDPREARALLGLGKIAQAQGNIPEAINNFAKALSISPQLEEARKALSQALGNFGAKP
jgi:tetratricopeptide (TPR) repeat protein